MDFYENLAPHYDALFPPDHSFMDFVARAAPSGPMRAYDAGCATGSAAIDLALAGWDVFGVDLSAPMIAIAREKALRMGAGRARFECGDMSAPDLVNDNSPTSLTLCLGNTLPHLDKESILRFLLAIRAAMAPGGLILIQTLNYSHPDIGAGFAFPAIAAEGSCLRRKYSANPEGGLWFETEVETGGIIHADRTALYPLQPETLGFLLNGAGFINLGFAGGWKKPDFDPLKDRYVISTGRVQDRDRRT